jgi:hypothetical protein
VKHTYVRTAYRDMIFPGDSDGDVLRDLEKSGFDFSQRYLIDFNVDFEQWPPSPKAMSILSHKYPSTKAYEPDGETPGYLQFQVYGHLTHALVTKVQMEVSNLMAEFNGECISWGIFHDPI